MSSIIKKPSTPRITATLGTVKKEASQPSQPMVGAWSLVAKRNGELCEVITVRTYMSASRNASTVRACVWIKPADSNANWHSGRGDAGGWGYHKESAAIADAISNAGVSLFGDPYGRDGSRNKSPLHFGGTGDTAYRQIFEAIAKAAGYKKPFAFVAH